MNRSPTTTQTPEGPAMGAPPRLRCIACGAGLEPASGSGTACDACGRAYPVQDGLLVARGALTGKNAITAAFYNSDRWLKFRPWERLFLWFQGGLRGARRQILRHLPEGGGDLLEVGIGDGENLPLLSHSWRIAGIDIAERPLAACRLRHHGRCPLLAVAEGEEIPFTDHSFDAVLCVGGFTYFRDPAHALREMARVTRPGGRVVVADEVPNLLRFGPGHLIGLPRLDRRLLERAWFGPEFTAMVFESQGLDIRAIAAAVLPGHRWFKIWNRLGYCIVAEPGGPADATPTPG